MAQDTPSLVAQVWTIQKTCRGASVESIYSETTVERGELRRASRWPDRLLPFFLFPTIQCAHGSRETAGEKGCPKPCGWAGAACGFHLPLMWPMSYVYMEEYTGREREREIVGGPSTMLGSSRMFQSTCPYLKPFAAPNNELLQG